MSDTFLSNRKEDVQQLKYLLGHKYRVYKAGRELDVPRLQLFMHDMRKFNPKEWVPYREYFYDVPDVQKFREAVKHHKKNNPHHVRPGNLEAVADWYATGEKKDIPFKDWVKKYMKTFPITEETRQKLLTKVGVVSVTPDVFYPNWDVKSTFGAKLKNVAKASAPLAGPSIAAAGVLASLYDLYRRSHVVKRKGVMGKVQQWGKARKHTMIGKKVYEHPELTTAGSLVGLGLLGSELL